MDPIKKADSAASSIKAEKLRRVSLSCKRPPQITHLKATACLFQRLLQSQLTLTSFGKKCPKNECA